MAKLKYVQGDTAPNFEFSVSRPDGTVPDLSGATVDFILEAPSGVVTNDGHQACVITDEAAGEGYYEFQTDDLSESGTYKCDLQITYASGQVETVPKSIPLIARKQAA